jgi:hypothetical protein
MNTIDHVYQNIMNHLSMLDLITTASNNILSSAGDDIDALDFKVENRQRMLEHVGTLQGDIEKSINLLDIATISNSDVEILKIWMLEMNRWVEQQLDLSDQITQVIESQKQAVSQEICSVFKNKSAVKGYNLNNLKK